MKFKVEEKKTYIFLPSTPHCVSKITSPRINDTSLFDCHTLSVHVQSVSGTPVRRSTNHRVVRLPAKENISNRSL